MNSTTAAATFSGNLSSALSAEGATISSQLDELNVLDTAP